MVFDEKTQKQLGTNLCKIEESCDFSSDSSKKFSPLTSSSSSSKTSSFCKLLEGVVLAANSAVSSQSTAVFQGQFGMSHQEALGTVIRQPKTQDEALESSTEQPPILQPGTKSQNPVTVAQEHMSSPREPKTPKSDTYSWRKYGQKHVKSSGSSRSYFRCTSLSCCAKKKVQHLDDSGEIIEVIYKGDHNHDPPLNIIKVFSRKKSFGDASVKKTYDTCREEPKQHVLQLTFESRDSHSNDGSAETLKSDVNEQHNKTPDTIARHQNELSTLPREVERGRSGNSNELGLIETMNERDIPIKKRRIKESGKESSQSVYRTFKEPKIVVQAPDGAGINSDGYKWRKYGQKMVKGNIHPRSYYRCSSPGCPVRKHVERATDGSLSIVAMYEGEHDHDKPLLKKQHGSLPTPSVLVNAHTDIPDKSSPVTSEEEKMASPSRAPSPQPTQSSTIDCDEPKPVPEAGTEKVLEPTQLSSNDCDEPKAVPEAGTQKVLDSAQTLLSVNIELESC